MAYTPGPYDSRHIYLQWGGKLPGNEQWSCGIRLAGVPNVNLIHDPVSMASAVAAVEAFHTSAGANISSAAKLSFVKYNIINVDGHYDEQVTHETVVADVGGAGGSPAPYPNQVALVVSLTTGVSRGPAHRGRFYLPLPTMGLAADGLISAANAGYVSGAVDTFVAALDALSPNTFPAVFSRKLGSPAHRAITGNLVGRVLDTQRRRRRSLVENYQ